CSGVRIGCIHLLNIRDVQQVNTNVQVLNKLPPFKDRLKRLRQQSGLSQEKFAKKLFIGRVTYNGLETGREEPSDWIVHQVNMLEQMGVEALNTIAGAKPLPIGEDGAPEQIRTESRRLLDQTLALAGDDVGKLGWVREQLIRHLSAPEHWGLHEKILSEVLAEEKKAAAERPRTQSPAKERNG
ncbi:MAG TPA: helix-turn-helix transcriptional regulator, partial [Opitutaceae bacterium]|nr:helix-turn-helix transcriptional regulator [Opitutaceae bacterium]